MNFLPRIARKPLCKSSQLLNVFLSASHTRQFSITHSLNLSSRSLNDRWGIKDDRSTTSLHFSLSTAFRRASPNPNPVHSDILSSHLFFCLLFLLPPCNMPCRIIYANPVDLVMCPYYLNLRFYTVVIRSTYGLMACVIVFLASSFVT